MLIIYGAELQGQTGSPGYYDGLKPWRTAEGVCRWIVDNDTGSQFVDTNGKTYNIRERTQSEIEATPEWAAWQEAIEATAQRQAARDTWQDLPDWVRTFTEAQINTFVDDNITDLASARTAFKSIAKTLRKLIDLQKLNYGG